MPRFGPLVVLVCVVVFVSVLYSSSQLQPVASDTPRQVIDQPLQPSEIDDGKEQHGVGSAFHKALAIEDSCRAKRSSVQRRECIISHLLLPFRTAGRAIEIGGPSQAYNGNPYPVYSHLAASDNVRFSDKTLWEKQAGGVYHWVKGKPPGRQFILDASNLSEIPSAAYDVVMSAHNLEHLANPLKAIAEQKRILKPLGALLIIVPHKEKTFDHRRPTSTFDHLLSDYRRDTPESDLSHLEDIVAMHDLGRDKQAGGLAKFRARSLDNFRNRGLHQHVFDEALLRQVLEHFGFHVVLTDVTDIHILAAAVRSEL